MAVEIHANILLDTDLSGNLPTNAYRVLHESYEDTLQPAVVPERSLTGKMHIHRVREGVSPMIFDGVKYELILTLAEKDRLLLDLGKTVYFMHNRRDESDIATYRHVMLFESAVGVRPFDPNEAYWRLVIVLIEATNNEV